MDRVHESIGILQGASEPPRKNGDLVFQAPWESRAFGMAVALHSHGAYTWEEFSAHLAAKIAAGSSGGAADAVLPIAPHAEAEYYQQWLKALETLVDQKGLVSSAELEARTAEFAAGKWDHEH